MILVSRARARDKINIYIGIREFTNKGQRTNDPLLVGLRKYYMQHWGSNKTGLKENFYKKQRKCGNKSKAFWTKVWTK